MYSIEQLRVMKKEEALFEERIKELELENKQSYEKNLEELNTVLFSVKALVEEMDPENRFTFYIGRNNPISFTFDKRDDGSRSFYVSMFSSSYITSEQNHDYSSYNLMPDYALVKLMTAIPDYSEITEEAITVIGTILEGNLKSKKEKAANLIAIANTFEQRGRMQEIKQSEEAFQ